MEHFNQFPETEAAIGFVLPVLVGYQSRLGASAVSNNKGMLVLGIGSTLIKKSVSGKIGGFDEELTLSEVSDWFFRMREADIQVRINKEVIQFYRKHDKNLTLNNSLVFHFRIFRMLMKY